MSYFTGALSLAIEARKQHGREAMRLRSLTSTITTAPMKARVLEQAEEHARRAGFSAEESEG